MELRPNVRGAEDNQDWVQMKATLSQDWDLKKPTSQIFVDISISYIPDKIILRFTSNPVDSFLTIDLDI